MLSGSEGPNTLKNATDGRAIISLVREVHRDAELLSIHASVLQTILCSVDIKKTSWCRGFSSLTVPRPPFIDATASGTSRCWLTGSGPVVLLDVIFDINQSHGGVHYCAAPVDC